jgi:hypothetical protein
VESGSFVTAKTFRIKQLNNSAKHSEREKINPAGKNHHNDQPLSDLFFARESRAPSRQKVSTNLVAEELGTVATFLVRCLIPVHQASFPGTKSQAARNNDLAGTSVSSSKSNSGLSNNK